MRWHDETALYTLLPQRVFLALPHVTRRSPCGITSWHYVVLRRNTWPCCDDVYGCNTGSFVHVAAARACLPRAATCAPIPRVLRGGWAVVPAAGPRAHPARACSRPVSCRHTTPRALTLTLSLGTRIYVDATHKRTPHAHECTESRRLGRMVQCRLMQSLNGGSAWRCQSYPLPAR